MAFADEKKYLEEYFSILDIFFKNLTGKTPAKFSSFHDLPITTRDFFQAMLQNIGASQKKLDTLKELEKNLLIFYAKNGKKLDKIAKEISGFKLLYSGNKHIGLQQYRAIKTGAFWADSVIVTDPIYPWIKDGKKNDRNRLSNILKEAFALLKLKNLFLQSKDSHLIWIYPSAESPFHPGKETEEDEQKLAKLITDFFNSYIDKNIYTYDDVEKHLEEKAEHFLKCVHQKGLFMVKGGTKDETQEDIIKRYKEEVANVLGIAGAKKALDLPPEQIVFKGLAQRLRDQLYLLEESKAMKAHPILPDEESIKYFSLIRNMNLRKLVIGNVFNQEELVSFKSIGPLSGKFPGDFPNKLLVSQRKRKDIAELRSALADSAHSLEAKTFAGDKISITKEIEEQVKVLKDYSLEFQDMLIESSASSLKMNSIGMDKIYLRFIPTVAPLIGTDATFIETNKYFNEKLEDLKSNQDSASSMLGFAVENII